MLKVENSVLLKDPVTGQLGYRNDVTGIDTPLVDGPTSQNSGTVAYDPPNISAGAQVSTTVNVPNAKIGDYVLASFTQNLQTVILSGFVSAPGVATIVLFNGGASDVNLPAGNLRVRTA